MKIPTNCIVKMEYFYNLGYFRYDDGDSYLELWVEWRNINIKNVYHNHASEVVNKLKEKDSIWSHL